MGVHIHYFQTRPYTVDSMHQDDARQYPSKRQRPGREGLSVAQISKVLGCEEAAVVRSLARGGLGDGEDRGMFPAGFSCGSCDAVANDGRDRMDLNNSKFLNQLVVSRQKFPIKSH